MSSIQSISSVIERLTQKYHTRDPFTICQMMDIKIRYMDLGLTIKAYYFYQSRIKNIVINSRAGEIIQKVLCAHELGHAILHTDLATMKGFHELELFDNTSVTEYEANLFAAELIIPDDDLFELLNDKDKSFFGISQELCIPSELLDFKFRILKNKGYHMEAPYIAQSNFLKNDIDGYFDNF